MSLAVVPVVFLGLLVLFSNADKQSQINKQSSRVKHMATSPKKQPLTKRVEKPYAYTRSMPNKKDEDTIYNYITKKFKNFLFMMYQFEN